MWQELNETLARLIQLYERVLILGKEKRDAMVVVDLKALDRILQQEEQVTGEILSAEENRKIILQKLAQLEPQINAGTKLGELCRYCPAETATKLEQLHTKLNQVTKEVSAIRDANRVLVSAALSAVNYHLNVLGDTAVAPVYGAGGSEHVSKSKKFDFEA